MKREICRRIENDSNRCINIKDLVSLFFSQQFHARKKNLTQRTFLVHNSFLFLAHQIKIQNLSTIYSRSILSTNLTKLLNEFSFKTNVSKKAKQRRNFEIFEIVDGRIGSVRKESHSDESHWWLWKWNYSRGIMRFKSITRDGDGLK